jgi:D-alanyl-D-alanine carboxypeptidase
MSDFGKYVHTIVDQAGAEAVDDGSATTEAQHLLLAIAAKREATTNRLLMSVGLDHAAIREALDREFERSLGAAGVSLAAFDLRRTRNVRRRPRLGASAKIAFERGFSAAERRSELRPAHLLLGILEAQAGTVPRALRLAGVDQTDLKASVRQLLAEV